MGSYPIEAEIALYHLAGRMPFHWPGLTSSKQISTLLQWFAYARLSRRCLTGSCPAFRRGLSDVAIERAARERGVIVRAMSRLYVAAPPRSALVIGFSGYSCQIIPS